MGEFIRENWYCAGWSAEIAERPKGIRILGEYLVLYRTAGGEAVAVTGRCPHRFAPLDLGVVIGDAIMCPYHGLQFGKDGSCILNPHGEGHIPSQAKLTSYPVAERHAALWVWLGEPEAADPALLPPETLLMSPDYATQFVYLNVGANYQLVIDNLLDLTHAPFLHPSTLAGGGDVAGLRHEFRTEGDTVHSDYFIPSAPPSPQMQSLFADASGSFSAEMIWRPCSNLELDIWQRPHADGGADPLNLASVHYLTPETDRSTHYFAAISRNLKIDCAEEDTRMRDFMMRAFTEEDEPMIRACQELMGTTDLFSLKPAILKTDIAAVQARRILQKRQSGARSNETVSAH